MSANLNFISDAHFVKGIDPVADAFAGTVYSDVVDMSEFDEVTFVVYRGVATGGTAVSAVTVQACDDTTPSNRTAVEFYYKAITSGDTQATLTNAASTGFSTTAGSSAIYLITVNSAIVGATGYGYVQLKMVESVDDPVVGCIMAILTQPRYRGTHNSQVD